MALYSISGTDCTCENDGLYGLPEIGARKSRAQRKAKRTERKVKRKARRTARRSGVNCKGRTVAKIAPPLVVGRKAFLLLVRLNAKKIAVKLYNRLQDPKKALEIYEKWCKLGGNAKVLRDNVNKAYAKYKRKRGIASVGEPVSLATIVATALPILTAMAKFLKPEKAEEIEEASSAIQQSTSNFSNEGESEDSGETTSGIFDNKKVLVYGALGIAGLYFLSKKKIFK
jgi:hypothetical protein